MLDLVRSRLSAPRAAQIVIDLVVTAIAFALAYVLRFEGTVPAKFMTQFVQLLPTVLAIRLLCRQGSGLHHRLWRYVNLQDAIRVVIMVSVGSCGIWLASWLGAYVKFPFGVTAHDKLPWGILAHDWWLNIAGYLGVRIVRRSIAERTERPLLPQRIIRVLLVGAGQVGVQIALDAPKKRPGTSIVGFVDDDRRKLHSRVGGLMVLGATKDLPGLIRQYEVDDVVVCIPSVSRARLFRILDLCRGTKVSLKLVPLADRVLEAATIERARKLQLEDLLQRSSAPIDQDALEGYLQGRVVMVTGAGGSVGAELCDCLARCKVGRLVILGRGEHPIYELELALRARYPEIDLVSVVADVRDREAIAAIFKELTPQVVFHLAADKQVPLMERNPAEAVSTNVFGTKVVAEAAHHARVEAFVFCSMTKAATPTSIMAATKHVAELLIQEIGRRSSTRFMSLRLGNVLGSRGSVVPTFRRQIEQGEAVTVTHPDVLRYFLTIKETAELILQAGALGAGGEVLMLDMGDPIRIVDLASDLIKLHGLVPDEDVKIVFTGLRPGEELFETSATASGEAMPTACPKVFRLPPHSVDASRLAAALAGLELAVHHRDPQTIHYHLEALAGLVGAMAPPPSPFRPG